MLHRAVIEFFDLRPVNAHRALVDDHGEEALIARTHVVDLADWLVFSYVAHSDRDQALDVKEFCRRR